MSDIDEKEVIALLHAKMEEAKQQLINEANDYIDWHLKHYGLAIPNEQTKAEYDTWLSKKAAKRAVGMK